MRGIKHERYIRLFDSLSTTEKVHIVVFRYEGSANRKNKGDYLLLLLFLIT